MPIHFDSIIQEAMLLNPFKNFEHIYLYLCVSLLIYVFDINGFLTRFYFLINVDLGRNDEETPRPWIIII